MDIEKDNRAELIAALAPSFRCFEHVPLRHAIFSKRVVICDVLAWPREAEWADLLFAFEVKAPDARKVVDVPFWTRTIKQAADYVYATIEPGGSWSALTNRHITSSFIYPTTQLRRGIHPPAFAGDDYLPRVWGAFEVATHFRVGSAAWEPIGRSERGRLSLRLGSEVWRSTQGFKLNAVGVFRGKRPIGSQQVDVSPDRNNDARL